MNSERTAIITGGSRGMGKAIAEQLASLGYDIIILAKDKKRADKAAREMAKKYRVVARSFSCDLSKTKEIDSFSRFCSTNRIVPSILVNNAGIYSPGPTEREPIETYDAIMSVNTRGMFYLTKKLLPLMKKTKGGRIVIISSAWALDSFPAEGKAEGTVYSISKWALRGWARSLRAEVRRHGIGVTIIYPGAVITDEWKGTEFPHKTFIQPEDIGRIVGTVVSTSSETVIEEVIVKPLRGDMHE